jgi:hypothetical protein
VTVGGVHCFLLLIPLVAGIVLLARSHAVAEWPSEKLDE